MDKPKFRNTIEFEVWGDYALFSDVLTRAGGIAKDGSTIVLSDTITSFTVNLDGDVVTGDSTNANFSSSTARKFPLPPP